MRILLKNSSETSVLYSVDGGDFRFIEAGDENTVETGNDEFIITVRPPENSAVFYPEPIGKLEKFLNKLSPNRNYRLSLESVYKISELCSVSEIDIFRNEITLDDPNYFYSFCCIEAHECKCVRENIFVNDEERMKKECLSRERKDRFKFFGLAFIVEMNFELGGKTLGAFLLLALVGWLLGEFTTLDIFSIIFILLAILLVFTALEMIGEFKKIPIKKYCSNQHIISTLDTFHKN